MTQRNSRGFVGALGLCVESPAEGDLVAVVDGNYGLNLHVVEWLFALHDLLEAWDRAGAVDALDVGLIEGGVEQEVDAVVVDLDVFACNLGNGADVAGEGGSPKLENLSGRRIVEAAGCATVLDGVGENSGENSEEHGGGGGELHGDGGKYYRYLCK